MRGGRVSRVAVALAALVGLHACAGARHSWEQDQTKKNEITARLSEIREWRREAGLSLEPHPQAVNQLLMSTIQQAKAVCPNGHAVTETCMDVCTLAEHICDNAEQICILADELGKDDAWAQEKCASAKASCREAKQRCCRTCSVSKAAW